MIHEKNIEKELNNMFNLLNDIVYPERGSVEETWTYEDVIFKAKEILDRINEPRS